MDTNDTETSSLTSKASLTRIHAESDLPFDHTSCRTKSGFKVEGSLLKGLVPSPPGKWQKRKWYWDLGEPLTRLSDRKAFHLCRLCWDNKSQKRVILTTAHGTQILRHMETHGYKHDGTIRAPPQKKQRTDDGNMVDLLQRQNDAQITTFVRSSVRNSQPTAQPTNQSRALYSQPVSQPRCCYIVNQPREGVAKWLVG
jgi:hypothetical protein